MEEMILPNMAQDLPSSSSLVHTKVAAKAAILLAIAFLAILFSLHFLSPESDPSWRLISEYQLGRYGWLMTLAICCWGGSVLALQLALRTSIRSTGGRIGRWWLGLIGAAMIGAGIFKTTASTDPNITTAAVLHALCAAIVALTLPLAASLVAGILARHQNWAPICPWLLWTTILVWFSLLIFFTAPIVSNLIDPTAGRVGPHVLLGWPNRFVAVAYSIWLLVLAQRATRLRPASGSIRLQHPSKRGG
jgi:hypothetical protein